MNLTSLEANPRVRYGFYLRPSFAMSRAQCEMHDILRRQFGLEVGGKFMPHATIMSFFRSDASISEISAALDTAVAPHAPYVVTNNGPIPHGRNSVTLDVQHNEDGSTNAAMQAVHESVYAALEPLLHPDCEFAFGNWRGEKFRAHLTLAMADIPDAMFDEVFEFVRCAGEIGPRQFQAEYFHLYAFQSDDWGGKWWNTLTWQDLKSWKLGG